MIYRAIGQMSGSSLDGIDLVMVEFDEVGKVWNYNIEAATTIPYPEEWKQKLSNATQLNAHDYLQLHSEYGHYLGKQIEDFIDKNELAHRVQLIASHGHTTFHEPQNYFTAQLGDGASIAAETSTNVVSDLRALDVALGGQGAPIVPMGERLLFGNYTYLLNLGGIANVTIQTNEKSMAFDIAAANQILNKIAQLKGYEFDNNGEIAKQGTVNTTLLTELNKIAYYQKQAPKSLANTFSTETIWPILEKANISVEDLARTYCEHISLQISYAIASFKNSNEVENMLITGGGAFNKTLTKCISNAIKAYNIQTEIPDQDTINYKEAIIMALLGILRWREENTTIASVTGAKRSSIGGAIWMGQEY